MNLNPLMPLMVKNIFLRWHFIREGAFLFIGSSLGDSQLKFRKPYVAGSCQLRSKVVPVSGQCRVSVG